MSPTRKPAAAAGPGPLRMANSMRPDEQEIGAHPRAPEPGPDIEVQHQQQQQHRGELQPVGAGRESSRGVSGRGRRRGRGARAWRRASWRVWAARRAGAARRPSPLNRPRRRPRPRGVTLDRRAIGIARRAWATESARRMRSSESSRWARSSRVAGEGRARRSPLGATRIEHVRRGARVGRRQQPVDPLPALLLPRHAGHGADRDALRIDAAQPGREHQRSRRAPSPDTARRGTRARLRRCRSDGDGATTPAAFPVTVKALTRNSGWAQVITMLVRCDTLSTTPISPSGATTGSNGRHAVAHAGAQEQRAAVGGLGLVQHFGGDVGAGQPAAQREQLAQALVLGDERRQALREVGGGVTLGGDGPETDPAGLAFFGTGLEPDQRRQHALTERVGDAEAPRCRRRTARPAERPRQTTNITVSRRVYERSDALAMLRRTGRCGISRSRRECGRCPGPRR